MNLLHVHHELVERHLWAASGSASSQRTSLIEQHWVKVLPFAYTKVIAAATICRSSISVHW